MRTTTRVGLFPALAGLLTTLLAVVAPAAARANDFQCKNPPDLGSYHEHVYFPDSDEDYLLVYFLKSFEPVFLIGGSVALENDGNEPQPQSKTVTDTHTFTVTTTHKASQKTTLKFGKKVSLEFGYEFTQQETDTRTTTVATTETFNLSPHTAKRADRGLEGVHLVYDLRTYLLSEGRCKPRPQFDADNVQQDVPTTVEHFRYTDYPNIWPGGIVDGRTYTYTDIHPGTTVAIFGNNFDAPNRVIVRQNGRRWEIGAGSLWWYESNGQINATLPADLTPGQYATVTIQKRVGLTGSLETTPAMARSVYIYP